MLNVQTNNFSAIKPSGKQSVLHPPAIRQAAPVKHAIPVAFGSEDGGNTGNYSIHGDKGYYNVGPFEIEKGPGKFGAKVALSGLGLAVATGVIGIPALCLAGGVIMGMGTFMVLIST